jgi:hypothetical protein
LEKARKSTVQNAKSEIGQFLIWVAGSVDESSRAIRSAASHRRVCVHAHIDEQDTAGVQ